MDPDANTQDSLAAALSCGVIKSHLRPVIGPWHQFSRFPHKIKGAAWLCNIKVYQKDSIVQYIQIKHAL